ncbi:type IV pilus modification PilV family protein [Trinickia acidisoli]|uniref:type IV pilus modification PilV family protein n=1 Tax=Trinickia acidisoli TaxID=2767482 RepID=UPI001A8C3D98|nr:hypothetical protein [Trinickia acidisoli]
MIAVGQQASACEGSSLLEVLIALALLATSILGAAVAQLGALRDADVQTHREQAAWAAVSIAEAMRLPEVSSHVLTRSRAHAAAALPGARVSVVGEMGEMGGVGGAGDVGAVVVHWAQAPGALELARASGGDPCIVAGAGAGAHAHCIALPFANGR